MGSGVKMGAKRGHYKVKIHKPIEEMSIIEWLYWIRCTTHLPRTKEDIALHRAKIDWIIEELSDE